MSEETTTETTVADAAEENVTTTEEAGVGGIVGERAPEPITTLEELVDLILSSRKSLSTSNQRNTDVFNQIQNFITEKSTGVTQLDGAISALSSFVTEDTPEDDEHVIKLNQLTTERSKIIEQLQNADAQRRNVFNSITMTEGALQILSQVLDSAGLITIEGSTEASDNTAETEEGATVEAE